MNKKILLILLIISNCVFAQKKIIHINKDGITNDTLLQPNQKILIIGELKESLQNADKISVSVISTSEEKPTKAVLVEKSYKILIGPFLPRDAVSIEISIEKEMKEKDKELLLKDMFGSLTDIDNKLKNYFEKSKTGISEDSVRKIFTSSFSKGISDELNSYKLDNKKLKDDFDKIFSKELNKDLIEKISNNYIEFTDEKDAVKKDTIKSNLNKLIERELVKPISEKVKASQIIDLQLFDVSMMVSEVMFHASFDITPMETFFEKDRKDSLKRNFGMFFTFSPYLFARIPPNSSLKDYANGGGNKFFRGLAYLIQPTIGIGIMGNKDISVKPVIYTGATLRFNQLFKITYGRVFNTKMSYQSVGLSININYFSEILKIFQTTQANLNF